MPHGRVRRGVDPRAGQHCGADFPVFYAAVEFSSATERINKLKARIEVIGDFEDVKQIRRLLDGLSRKETGL